MTTALNIRRAMLEGALHKANDAVHADNIQDHAYAMQAYGDSCAMLARVMERTERGSPEWKEMDSIRASYIRRVWEIRENMPYPRHSKVPNFGYAHSKRSSRSVSDRSSMSQA